MAPVYDAVPQPVDEDWRAAARWACREAARVGFVGVHSLMAHDREIRALVDVHRSEGLPVRVTLQIPYSLLETTAAAGYRTGFGDGVLSLGAVKLFSDGSLGARTAALREPYSDASETSGELIYSPEELAARVARVYAAGFQVAVHAIGDRAMDVTLDAIEHGRLHAPPGIDVPPARIEHASVVDAGILGRMRGLGVGAAIQPQFAWSDYWAGKRLGERAAGCYAFRALHEAGIALAGSTDCPVERMDAVAAIGQLVHRPPWLPENGLALPDALRIFSEGSYQLLGRPAGTGALAAGQPCDFVVLAEDPRLCAAADLEKIPVRMTVVGGRVQYAT
jgi:hypothetical protein